MTVNLTKPVFTLIYDSQCPICSREIAWLKSLDKQHQLRFQDIYDDDFEPSTLGLTRGDLLAEIHGITTEGQLLKGLDVFAITYELVGLPWLAKPLQCRILRPVLDWLYWWFARNRSTLRLLPMISCQNDQCCL